MTVPIVFCVDGANLMPAAVSIQSIVDHASTGEPLEFVVIYDPTGPGADLAKFKHFVSHWSRQHRISIIVRSPIEVPQGSGGDLPRATFLRLYVPSLLPDHARALYLDADLILATDIRPLLATVFKEPIAGVIDYGVRALRQMERYFNEQGLWLQFAKHGLDIDRAPYVNAGVLLLDLEQLRRRNFTAQTLELIARDPRLIWSDQTALNIVMQGQIGLLDPRWNAIWAFATDRHIRLHLNSSERAGLDAQLRDPRILHYAGQGKPWLTGAEDLWWSHVKMLSPQWGPRRRAALRFRAIFPKLRPSFWDFVQGTPMVAIPAYRLLRLVGRGDGWRHAIRRYGIVVP